MPDELMPAAMRAAEHACWTPDCSAIVGVQWQRRLTADELAVLDPPLPAGGVTRVVHACTAHAIELGRAARIHQASCAAPGAEVLPLCACTPEQLPAPAADMDLPTVTLPSGWTVLIP